MEKNYKKTPNDYKQQVFKKKKNILARLARSACAGHLGMAGPSHADILGYLDLDMALASCTGTCPVGTHGLFFFFFGGGGWFCAVYISDPHSEDG